MELVRKKMKIWIGVIASSSENSSGAPCPPRNTAIYITITNFSTTKQWTKDEDCSIRDWLYGLHGNAKIMSSRPTMRNMKMWVTVHETGGCILTFYFLCFITNCNGFCSYCYQMWQEDSRMPRIASAGTDVHSRYDHFARSGPPPRPTFACIAPCSLLQHSHRLEPSPRIFWIER